MSSLTEISIATRKFFVWVVVVVIGYFVLRILIGLGIEYWKATHPIPIPPPNVRFNKLPSPRFSHVATSSSGMTFTLETVEGRPPETTAAGKIYAMPKKLPNLLASDRARKIAYKIGFTEEPEAVTSTLLKFTDPAEPLRTFEIDITNMNFRMQYDYLKNPQVFNMGSFASKDQALSEVKHFTQFNNLFDETVLKGKITTDLLIYDDEKKTFQSASSLSNANAIRLNYFRNDLDGMPILPPEFNKSYTYAIFTAGSSLSTRIIELSYIFWLIALDDFATYPLISSEVAWQDLKDGYAYVVNMGRNTPENIVVRKIYLAYYDNSEAQTYLQPIFVFEGDNDFIAYLPAIDPSWLDQGFVE